MAISVNWTTKVISILQADLTNVSVGLYRLDIDAFRLALKDLEDGEGMPFPDTHRHNTSVSLGGLTLARVVEFINGYTITFEDGMYAVELVGANSNIAEVTNINQVSVRSANSAGLVQVSTGSGLSSGQDSTLTAIAALTSRLDAMLEDAGSYDRWLATALEESPAGSGGGWLTAQQVRDAMKLAPTAGSPASGSVDADLDVLVTRNNPLDSTATQAAAASALTAYDPPTKAELDSAVAGLSTFDGDLSALATAANLSTVDGIVDDIKAKTDQLTFTVAGQVDANALTGGGGDDAATIYGYFTASSRQDTFKADVSGLLTSTAYTAGLPPNFGALAIDGSGRTTVGTNADKTGYGLTNPPLDSTATQAAAAAAITAASLSTLTLGDIGTALTNYGAATGANVTDAQTAILAGGFTSSDRSVLVAADAAARALADGRFAIDYANSIATQYEADGTVRTVFDLEDENGNPATSAQSAVNRVPQ